MTLLNPIYANVSPLAPIPLLVKQLEPRIRLAVSRRAELVLVILDSEKAASCPGERATQITTAFANMGVTNCTVVLKHTRFENWLIADREALYSCPGLFPAASRLNYPKGRADSVDALRLLTTTMGNKVVYSKMRHPEKVLAHADIIRMRANSRSFNKFLRTLSRGG